MLRIVWLGWGHVARAGSGPWEPALACTCITTSKCRVQLMCMHAVG